ncbi:hypothetical protein A9Z50_06285 [Aeromonas hydrophila]|nr:hypothetical protein [Aeromonas hydrophila]
MQVACFEPVGHLGQPVDGDQAAITRLFGQCQVLAIAKQQGAIFLHDAVVSAQWQPGCELLKKQAALVIERSQNCCRLIVQRCGQPEGFGTSLLALLQLTSEFCGGGDWV